METFNGKPVSSGIAFGRTFVLLPDSRHNITPTYVDNVEDELSLYERVKATAIDELDFLYNKTITDFEQSDADIFAAHKILILDEEFNGYIINLINQKYSARSAIINAREYFSSFFNKLEDDYMRQRGCDVEDICARLLNILENKDELLLSFSEPTIIIAEDLTPSTMLCMDKNSVVGIVTKGGSPVSHVAILAKSMNIPYLINADYSHNISGCPAILDGNTGKLIICPDTALQAEYSSKHNAIQLLTENLTQLIGQPNITIDGKTIDIYANIGNVSEAELAAENDAGGIGLFRSEFLYLQHEHYPTEDEQYDAYKAVAEIMGDREVIIRTMDIGADKKIDYFSLPPEENPALGYRAIRICIDRPWLFKVQLRAILRANVSHNISLMFPMIISTEEVKEIKRILNEVTLELMELNIPYKMPRLGVMIETPAAVMISDELAKMVDFFSIGTNDLTQYTLAFDRENSIEYKYYEPHHPAIMKMIEMVVKNAKKHGCKVAICGELAADSTLTKTFINLGVDELSVAPNQVLKLRKTVRETDCTQYIPTLHS